MFSLPSSSLLLKLPTVTVRKAFPGESINVRGLEGTPGKVDMYTTGLEQTPEKGDVDNTGVQGP